MFLYIYIWLSYVYPRVCLEKATIWITKIFDCICTYKIQEFYVILEIINIDKHLKTRNSVNSINKDNYHYLVTSNYCQLLIKVGSVLRMTPLLMALIEEGISRGGQLDHI